MRLAHLDQLIPLERGEAGILAHALAVLVHDAQGVGLTRTVALQLTPMARLGKRLAARHRQEQLRPLKPGKRPAARVLRVHYDELAVVLECGPALYYTNLAETEKWQLQRVLGEFQRYSLNLGW